ncbi:MAG: hypothetical protein KC506_03295, partial [Nanoarchaeota archaeon]|nr:hypothetical protein [Nanoarchaeota archaeon]
MKKDSLLGKLGTVAAFAGLAGLVNEGVGAAEIKPVPEEQVWVADGVTKHKVYVQVDNTGLGGEQTVGAQWSINNPGFAYVNGSSSVPSANDFFANLDIFFDDFVSPGNNSIRVVQPYHYENSPANSVGNVGQYEFITPTGMSEGTYTFSLGE